MIKLKRNVKHGVLKEMDRQSVFAVTPNMSLSGMEIPEPLLPRAVIELECRANSPGLGLVSNCRLVLSPCELIWGILTHLDLYF